MMPDRTAPVTDTEGIRVWLERTLKNQEELLNQLCKHQSALLADFDNTFSAPSLGNQCIRPGTAARESEETSQEGIGTLEGTMPTGDNSALPEQENEENVLAKAMFPFENATATQNMAAIASLKQPTTYRSDAPKRSVAMFLRTKFSRSMAGVVYVERKFEVASMLLILCNIAVMAAERQWYGMRTGYDIGFYNESPHRYWFHPSYFEAINVCMFTVFLVELILRIVAAIAVGVKLLSFSVLWISLDILLMTLEAMAFLAHFVGGRRTDVRPSLLRALHVLKLLRVLKLFREVAILDSLVLLISAIRASLSALCWSFLLLFLMQVVIGLLLSEGFDVYVRNSPDSRETRLKVFEYFGTFSRVLITMFEIVLGNWVPICRFLMEQISEKYIVFFVVYRCMLCFAVVRVISAVFIAETNRMLADDEDLEVRKKCKARRRNEHRMKMLFPIMSGCGRYISKHQLVCALNHESIRQRLSVLDIAVHDIDALFEILDDTDKGNGVGVVELKDFIKGMSLLKGTARSLDVMYLRKQTKEIVETLAEISKNLHNFQRKASCAKVTTVDI